MELTSVEDTVTGPASTFTGDVYLTPIHRPQPPSRLNAVLVRFAPGARTHWHSHAVGQTLHVTEGAGLVVDRDGTVIRMRAGDTVWTPPGQEHWHGGTNHTMMCHLAMIEVTADGAGVTWLDAVTDEEYAAAHRD
jgi:quercetin dioxygenase-like cupin family protein